VAVEHETTQISTEETMPKYLIERELPGAGNLSAADLQGIAQKSCGVLQGEVGAGYHWIESYVTADRIYCVHIAPNQEAVHEHARLGGFPVDRVMEIRAVIDPTTAEVGG
jgi:hypothetical protein